MKKYHQLLLLIISVISLSLFLIYRHEYNRLHYVLEVFNFFGQPCNFSELQDSEKVLNQLDWGPQPVWQDSESGYIYSAFLNEQIDVVAIAIQDNSKNLPRNCYLWFEEKRKPVLGNFKFSKITDDNGNEILNGYFYKCSLPNVEHVPYAVSFSPKVKRDNDLKKILLTNNLKSNIHINTTICVSPSSFNKKQLLEFISFHKLLGVDNFIFYNREIPYRLTKIITNLSNKLSIHATFLLWNYPKTDSSLVRTIVEHDCLLRTSRKTKFVVTLELNEYVVPTDDVAVLRLINTDGDSFYRLSLPVQKFCIDSLDMSKPIALQNFEVADDFNYNIVRYIYNNTNIDTNSNVVNTNALDKARGSIHKYIKCSIDPHKTHTDKSILRFSTDFIRTTLVQLLLHNQI